MSKKNYRVRERDLLTLTVLGGGQIHHASVLIFLLVKCDLKTNLNLNFRYLSRLRQYQTGIVTVTYLFTSGVTTSFIHKCRVRGIYLLALNLLLIGQWTQSGC